MVLALFSLHTFGNTEPRLLQTILGRPPDDLGAKYHDALCHGHTVTQLIMETFRGMAGHACLLLRRLALLRDALFLPNPLTATPLAASFCGLPRSVYLACTPLSSSTPDPCFADYKLAWQEPQLPSPWPRARPELAPATRHFPH